MEISGAAVQASRSMIGPSVCSVRAMNLAEASMALRWRCMSTRESLDDAGSEPRNLSVELGFPTAGADAPTNSAPGEFALMTPRG